MAYIRRAMVIKVYVNEEQHSRFLEGFNNSSYRIKSDYGKNLLLGKPVKTICRNRSIDDLVEMGAGLRKDLRRLLAGETFEPSQKEELSARIGSIEEHLIKLIELCGHT